MLTKNNTDERFSHWWRRSTWINIFVCLLRERVAASSLIFCKRVQSLYRSCHQNNALCL